MREVDSSRELKYTDDADERSQKPEDIFSCVSKEIFAAPQSKTDNRKSDPVSESLVEKSPQKKDLPPLPYADASKYPPYVDNRGLPKVIKDRREGDAASPTSGKARSQALTEIPSIKELFKSLNLKGTKDQLNEPLPYADASMYPPPKQVTRNSDELPSWEKPKGKDATVTAPLKGQEPGKFTGPSKELKPFKIPDTIVIPKPSESPGARKPIEEPNSQKKEELGRDIIDFLNSMRKKPEKEGDWTVTDQVETGKKLDDNTIEKYANDIATILMRNTDFAYGPKKERMQKMFEEAGLAGKESFDKLVAAINKKLEPSGMKLHGKLEQWTSENTEIQYPKNKDRNLDVYCYPSKVTTSKDVISMDLSLKSKGGLEEDKMSLSKDIKTRVKSEIYNPGIGIRNIKQIHDLWLLNTTQLR